MVSIDGSLFAEIGIIILLIFILNRLLYKPLLAMMEHRRKRLEDEQIKYESIHAANISIGSEIADTLRAAREKAQKQIQEALIETERNNRKKISESRENSEKLLDENQTEVQNLVEDTRRNLQSEISNLTRTFIAKVMPVLLVCCMAAGTVCLGSESHGAAAGHENAESHEGGVSEMARAVDFIAMAALLTYLLRKKITTVLDDRIQTIKSNLEFSTARIESEQKQLEQIELRKASIESELQAIAAEGKIREQKLTSKLMSQANSMIDKINRDTQMLMQAEIIDATAGIQKFVVDQSIFNVKSHFSSGIDLSTDSKLIESFLNDFDRIYRINKRQTHE